MYVPGVPVITGPTEGDPAVLLNDTFFTNLGGAGLPIALPYVIDPLIEGVSEGVGVEVGVAATPVPLTLAVTEGSRVWSRARKVPRGPTSPGENVTVKVVLSPNARVIGNVGVFGKKSMGFPEIVETPFMVQIPGPLFVMVNV